LSDLDYIKESLATLMRDQGVQRPEVLAASQEEYAFGFPKPI